LDSTAECVNITSGVWSTSGIKIRSNTRLILNERTRIEAKINVTQTAVVCSGCVRFSIESDILYALKNRYTSIMPNMWRSRVVEQSTVMQNMRGVISVRRTIDSHHTETMDRRDVQTFCWSRNLEISYYETYTFITPPIGHWEWNRVEISLLTILTFTVIRDSRTTMVLTPSPVRTWLL
jgi:hypothetical protein